MAPNLKITPTRLGTSLLDRGDFYLKTSENTEKIDAEFQYFKNLPKNLQSFHPEVSRPEESEAGSYLIKKINCLDAAIIIASSDNFPKIFVNLLLGQIEKFLNLCSTRDITPAAFQSQVKQEIESRNCERADQIVKMEGAEALLKIARENGFADLFDLAQQLSQLSIQLSEQIAKPFLIFSHGDLCLSNLLLLQNQLFLIDPRGRSLEDDGFRSPYYDYAKLSQCLLGGYDFINYGLPDPSEKFKAAARISFTEFLKHRHANMGLVRAYEASHFFSMIPLHRDHPLKAQRFLQKSIEILKELS